MSQISNYNNSNSEIKLEIVFTLETHQNFGLIFQVQAVEKLSNGEFSMNFSKVRIQNAEFYGMTPDDIAILNLIEEYETDNLISLFYTGKKRIKNHEFCEKFCTEDIIKNKIRPFIDNKILKIIELLKGKTIYYWGNGIVNQWLPVKIKDKESKVIFSVDRTESGMKYYANVFHEDKKIEIQNEQNVILVERPAVILINNYIHFFSNQTDAKKIAIFFNKTEIIVPKTSEKIYLTNFILPLVQTNTVETKGITINEIKNKKQAIINFMASSQNTSFLLEFTYGDSKYPAHSTENGFVSLEKGAEDWIISLSKRDFEWEEKMIKTLSDYGFSIRENSTFNLPQKLLFETFITKTIPALQKKGFAINQEKISQAFCLAKPIMVYTFKESNDWFDINIVVKFDSIEVPFKKLRSHIINNNNIYLLPDGTLAIIPQEWFQKLSPIIDCANESKDELKIGKYHYGLLEVFDELGINRSGETMKSLIQTYKKVRETQAPETIKAKLRKYQIKGLQWLITLNENGFGGLLADDMGLGKTIQTLAFFEWFIENKRKDVRTIGVGGMFSDKEKQNKTIPFLVVVPTSLLHNWKSETEKFSQLNCFIYAGNQRNRYIWEYFNDFELIITTYGTIRNDRDVFGRVNFDVIVFDEAQNLKNQSSLTVKAANELISKQKILLTGTPIENSTSDLWSLMNIANKGILGSYSKFQKNFIQKIEKKNDSNKINELKSIVAPFILRRTKEEVAKELPPRHEQIIYCTMEAEQEKLYEKTKSFYRNDLLKIIDERGIDKTRLHILKGLLRLRQIANHPVLIDSELKYDSGKFNMIIESLNDIVSQGNKVLVFSQFVTQLRLFKNKLKELNINFAYIDGAVSAEERLVQVDKFQKTDNCKVFLISLKAGGVGLNLTAADYVFIVDPWWNPAVERQAMDRAHRIGREKPVFVYKYITEKTVEEKIIQLQNRKKKLASDLISEDASSWFAKIDKQDLEDILN